MLITDTLEDEGYEIDVACDGQEALAMIEKNDYRLLILDYMMPKMTGLEVIPKVRSLPDRKHAKILMLSAKTQQSEQDRVMAAGADDFMPKPFSPMELVRRVEELLNA
jgi:DNA-binding response OmpR family regulator